MQALGFSPDGRILASRSGAWERADGPGELILWDAIMGRRIAVRRRRGGAVTWVDFSPDGRLLADGSSGGTVRLWDLARPQEPREVALLGGHQGWMTCAAFSPDGSALATGCSGVTGSANLQV